MLVLKPKLRFFFALFYDQPYSWSFCFLPHSISDFNQDLSFVCKYCFYFCSYGRTDSDQSIYSRLINFNGKRWLKKLTQCFFLWHGSFNFLQVPSIRRREHCVSVQKNSVRRLRETTLALPGLYFVSPLPFLDVVEFYNLKYPFLFS